MKLLIALSLLVVASVAPAQGFLTPSNPPPVVQLAWNASPSSGISNYFVYYGLGSGQYTAKIIAGNNTNLTLTLPARGQTFYFAVTAQTGSALESVFSNEVNFTPAVPPTAPSVKPIVVLTAQVKTAATGWVDLPLNYSLAPDQQMALFRLQIAATQTPPMPNLSHRLPPALPPMPK